MTGTLLRIGIVGTGQFGTRIGRQVRSLPDATVAALADVDGDALATAGTALGVPAERRFADYQELLADVDLDAVVVATPHALHYEQITAALDGGLHVLSEKPLVVDLDHNRELLARAESGETVLMVGFQRHLDAAFRRARERYDDGPAVTHVTAEVIEDWIGPFEGTWRTDYELSRGGYLTDTGRHVVDAVLWTTGLDPVSVRAEMDFPKPNVEKRATLDVAFEGGARAVIAAVGDARSVRESYHVWDEDGGVRIFGRGWGDRKFARTDDTGDEYRPLLDRFGQRTKAEAFVDAIRAGEPLPATPRDAFRTQAVVEAAYESVESGERVAVPSE
jgi:predicted dehydrogenase